MRSYLFAAVALAIFCSVCTAAWCQETAELPYSAKVIGVEVNSPTSNIWTYTIYNTSSSSDYTVWSIGISLDEGTLINKVTAPSGWQSVEDPYCVSLFASGPELAAGASQSGFTVEFNRKPLQQDWSIGFNNAGTGESLNEFGTVTPASTPEPGSVISLLVGLTSLAALAKKRRN